MTLPVYRELGETADSFLGSGADSANAGLVHEKYVDSWKASYGGQEDKSQKQFLQGVAKLAGAGQAAELLKEYHSRRRAMAQRQGGQQWRGQSLWRLVAGMGRANPLKIGFNWDHRLGVPRLPGSSLKGAVLSWARACLDPADQGEVQRIFGSPEQAGSVVLLDAYPRAAGALDVDLMNVHYKSYYASGGAPTGMERPTLLLFLAVPADTEWATWILPRTGGGGSDAQKALAWLDRCAAEWGLGAKTNVGYGYFESKRQTGQNQPAVREEEWPNCRLRRRVVKGEVQVEVKGGTSPLVIQQRVWQPIETGLEAGLKEALRRGRALQATLRVQCCGTEISLLEVQALTLAEEAG